jgi:RES domain-containing protein
LPPDWRNDPPPPALAVIGDAWVKASQAAVLEIPSAIVQQETHYLLNPAHRDCARIRIGEPEAFSFDGRLTR